MINFKIMVILHGVCIFFNAMLEANINGNHKCSPSYTIAPFLKNSKLAY
jgi:hypothetical protein